MPKRVTFQHRLRRFRRLAKLFVAAIGDLSLLQVGLFLVTPLALVVYLSFSSEPRVSPPAITPLDRSLSPAPLPISKNLPIPSISAKQVFIMDKTSKMVLFQKSAADQIYPASTTKMMTALVALEKYPLTQMVTVTRSYPDGQNISLSPGETISVEQLLYAMLVQSANDAAEILAENYSGGRPVFVEAMNARAAQLQLTNTRFQNPTGLDEDGHYSSAIDLVRLAYAALKNPQFAKIVATENSVITGSSSKTHVLNNINQLLGQVSGVKGVKSGQTDKSGQSLVTLVERDGHSLLLAVLGSLDRFADTKTFIDWSYSNFYWVDPDKLDQLR